ncbi:uncharacterized protein LOC143438581 [Arvicanthis niloticus]|uniref:uncharacterized protein LOC143438581 n=1 Tax=Arvicanthis niloticus TaxID=61156 RepID=UPI00403C419F
MVTSQTTSLSFKLFPRSNIHSPIIYWSIGSGSGASQQKADLALVTVFLAVVDSSCCIFLLFQKDTATERKKAKGTREACATSGAENPGISRRCGRPPRLGEG